MLLWRRRRGWRCVGGERVGTTAVRSTRASCFRILLGTSMSPCLTDVSLMASEPDAMDCRSGHMVDGPPCNVLYGKNPGSEPWVPGSARRPS